MNLYIENPAIARAAADNERRQAESDAAEPGRPCKISPVYPDGDNHGSQTGRQHDPHSKN